MASAKWPWFRAALIGFVALIPTVGVAATPSTGAVVDPVIRPVARVGAQVDDTKRVVLGGHVPPAIRGATDLGRLPAETALRHMIMVLRPSAEQDHALQTLLDRQLDKASPSFHKWLQPEEFGNRFGVADEDIAKVAAWLRANGMTVEQVAKGKRLIQFSGSVDQVEKAFRTEMHSFDVNGKAHISNNSDISVPAALRPVIAGVPTLNNFFKKSNVQPAGTLAERNAQAQAQAEPAQGKTYFATHGHFDGPAYTNGTTHFVGAADFATIYNTAPLIAGGFDGTGISIGVVGRTDIHLEDVQMYRQFFSLKVNDPTFLVAGEDPGVVGGDDGESYLDVEVSGGAAPGATIKFVTSRATLITDGVDLSSMYIVENNLTDIISVSYGQCEANFSAAAVSFFTNLWGQAAAQGQTVFVSTGDNGPAGCDSSSSTLSSFGYAVSALAATPFNVAVGGTLFADTTGGPWWGTTATASPPFSSALGYIPEAVWNEARGSGATGASGLGAGSSGISAYFTTPPWQHGFGVPAADPAYPNLPTFVDPASPFVPGPHRYLPDVSLAAAAQHDGMLYCGEGICQLSSTNTIVNAGIIGGTSVSTPAMAGIQALIDQFNGGRQGMANYVYYALADAQHTGGLDCNASHAGSTLDPNCAFRDVTTGNNLVCTDSGCTASKKIGWTAGAGYDLATGLGSPNAAKLANLWNTVTFTSSTTTLNASQTTGLTHGQSVTLSGTVASLSGTPTGNVTFIPSSGGLGNPMDPNTGAFLNAVPLATLDGSGNYSVSVTNLPAGTYNVVARYGGDGTFAASTSAPIQFTIGAEGTTVTIAPNAFNGTTCIETPATTFTYGSYVWTDVTVAGSSGQGVPTGTVTITDNSSPLVTTALNANGEGHFLSGAIPSSSCVNGYTFQDAPPLTVGTHVLGASYSGDSSFGVGSATPVTVTITPATVAGALATSASNIGSAGTVQLTFTLTGLSGAGPGTLSPTGTVTFTDTTTSAVLGTATLNPTPATASATAIFGARAVLSTTGITAAGANSITASWPGDTNYAAVTSSAVTVTVQAVTSTTVTVTSNANPTTVGGRPTWTATMSPTTVTSGTVGFYDGDFLLGTGTVGAAHTTTFRPAASVNLPAGVHNITAVYQGNATFNSSVSTPFAETFNQTATTVQLSAKNSGTWGQLFTMSGALGLAGTVIPQATGTLQFIDGASPLGSPQPFTIVTAAQGGFGIFQAQMGTVLTAGTHTLTAQLTDPNYTAPVSNTQIVTVSKATPLVSSTGGTFTYDGNPHAGSGSAIGGAGESLAVTLTYTGTGGTTYGPSTTPPTNAGTYQVVAHTDGDSNNTAGDSAAAALTISLPPDLSLTKSDGGASVAPGGTVAYTLTYANGGTVGATGVVITETVPANTAFNSGASTAGWVCTPNGNAGSSCTLAIGSVPAGGGSSAIFSVTTVNPLPAGVTQISNTASIADDGTHGADPAPGNNTASDTTPVTGAPDLSLTKSDGGASVAPGGTVTYILTYSNSGNRGASGVVITETVPANTTFNAGASTAGWACTPNGNAGSTCTLAVGSVVAGDGNHTATFAVTVDNPVPAGTTQISNTASIADDGTNGTDPTPANNTGSDTTPVTGAAPDLSLTKSDGGASAVPGGGISYTLTYANSGSTGATGVVLTETVPANTTFNAGGSTAGWSCTPNGNAGSTCTLAIGAVAAGDGNHTATFAVTLSNPVPAGVTQISNTASVADDGTNGTDPNLGNNTASDTTPITGAQPFTDYYSVAPCRLLDTRAGGSGGPLVSGVSRVFMVAGSCGIPADAVAVSVSLAVVTPPADGFVTLYPGDAASVPVTSTINFHLGGFTLSNNAIVQLASNGAGTIGAQSLVGGGGGVDVVIDVVGYFK